MASVNWPNWVGDYEDPNSSRLVGEMSYTKLPDATQVGVAHIGMWLMGMFSTSPHKDLAFEFMHWVNLPEQQKYAAIEIGLPPTRYSVMTDPEVNADPKNPHLKVLMGEHRVLQAGAALAEVVRYLELGRPLPLRGGGRRQVAAGGARRGAGGVDRDQGKGRRAASGDVAVGSSTGRRFPKLAGNRRPTVGRPAPRNRFTGVGPAGSVWASNGRLGSKSGHNAQPAPRLGRFN